MDVQVGQIPLAQGDQVSVGAEVRLQGGHWLTVAADLDSER